MEEQESKDVSEKQRFMQTFRNAVAGGIAATKTEVIVLQPLIADFGRNYNTLTITNTSTEAISVILDGEEVQYIQGNGGVWGFDWENGLKFSMLSIKNEHATDTIAQNEIKISVGRTGRV